MDLMVIIKYAFDALLSQRLRTYLSIIAIAIGMFTIALLTGISNGIKKELEKTAFQFGSDLIIVIPTQVSGNIITGSARANFIPLREKLTEKDLEKLKLVKGVQRVVGLVGGYQEVKYKNENRSLNIAGIEPKDIDILPNVKIKEGRFINGKSEAFIGSKIAESLDIMINTQIEIKGKKFNVVGIAEPTGAFLQSIDERIIIDLDDARNILNDTVEKDQFSIILLKVSDGFNVNDVANDVDKVLSFNRISKNVKGYSVITSDIINENIGKLLSTVNIFFLAISFVSIIIGLVGLANTLYMSIIDRTRELATLRAIGATINETKLIVTIQGIMITFISIIISYSLALFLGYIQPFVPFIPDFGIIIITGFIVLALSALISYISSDKLKELKLTEALRYE